MGRVPVGLRLDEPESESEPDPSDSMFRRAKKTMDDSKMVELVIRWGLVALVGGGASMATHKVEDAKQEAAHFASEAKVMALEAELDSLRERNLELLRAEEKDRESAIEKLRDRVLYLEARTGIRTEPPAAAAAPAEAPPPHP